jgi:hypothetical protein
MDAKGEQPLLSIERQFETDIATGRTEVRMFIKMYFEARDSGLLADIGDHRWRTLCCLATYMNAEGQCCPGQERIARDLGISRQQANRRIADLASYRFRDRPVLRIEKTRRNTASGGRWANNVYHIQPISGLGIFADRASAPADTPSQVPMSSQCDTGPEPVSTSPASGRPDMNKSQVINKNHTEAGVVSGDDVRRSAYRLVERFHSCRGHSKARLPTGRELGQAADLVRARGVEMAEHILSHALHQATVTRFEMNTFGAVLQYVPDAIEGFGKRKLRRDSVVLTAASDHRARERRDAIDRHRAAMDQELLADIEAAARAHVEAERGDGDRIGFELLVRARADKLIADQLDHDSANYDSPKSRCERVRAERKAS